jgi:DNA invertase Pin-like site-specific DNA recombinase
MHPNERALSARGPSTAGQRETVSGPTPAVPGPTPDGKVLALGYQSVRAPARITDPQLRRQAKAIHDHCRRKGWDLLALPRDIDAGHGRGSGQPALSNAIERLRRGEASCLVVAELRQLCRSVAEVGGILEAVERADARFVSLEPPFDTGTPIGSTVGRMLTTVSGWERARRADMTAAARLKARVAPAIPSRLRRRIVQMRNAGMTLQGIADQLNESGVPTSRGGAKWRPSSVQAALGYKRPRPWRAAGEDDSTAP